MYKLGDKVKLSQIAKDALPMTWRLWPQVMTIVLHPKENVPSVTCDQGWLHANETASWLEYYFEDSYV